MQSCRSGNIGRANSSENGQELLLSGSHDEDLNFDAADNTMTVQAGATLNPADCSR
jgi:FAD/FMN-containing dehydrogenase